ncbi:MAG: hypothetical protein K0S57_4271 [Ramlibacter sp.]|jgi:uncharacterized membrane protein HdeD (DUF308 family)|nr:hypothetical protein [Ramlibacter sp.]
MLPVLSNAWWMLLLRGAGALLFGVAGFVRPQAEVVFGTILLVLMLFVAYAALAGLAGVAAALLNRGRPGADLLALLGVAHLAAVALALVYPAPVAIALVLAIGLHALATGVLDVWIAIRLRRQIRTGWLWGTAGVLSILLGGYLLAFAGAGVAGPSRLVFAYAAVLGVLFIALGLQGRLRPDRSPQAAG